MAGDWIKVEQATLHKAEVLRMAELLGISRRECVGLLLDFWAWLDNNARTEFVPNLSRLCLDSVLNCPGFSAALVAVGWIEWDDSATSARIVNYSHHNGASAKTRAYEQKRKQIQREKLSRVCPEKVGPEKRREEIDTSLRSVSKAPPAKARIDAPTEEHERLAAERGLSCLTEFAKYRDWQAATGKRHKDEVAGFRNWLRNAQAPPARGFVNDELAARKLRAARNMDILTGKVDGRERVITAERVDSAPVFALPGRVRESGRDDVEGCRPDGGPSVVGG